MVLIQYGDDGTSAEAESYSYAAAQNGHLTANNGHAAEARRSSAAGPLPLSGQNRNVEGLAVTQATQPCTHEAVGGIGEDDGVQELVVEAAHQEARRDLEGGPIRRVGSFSETAALEPDMDGWMSCAWQVNTPCMDNSCSCGVWIHP